MLTQGWLPCILNYITYLSLIRLTVVRTSIAAASSPSAASRLQRCLRLSLSFYPLEELDEGWRRFLAMLADYIASLRA